MDLLQLSILADEIKKYSVGSHKFFFTFFFFTFFHNELLEGLCIGKVMHYCTTFLLMHLSGTNDI